MRTSLIILGFFCGGMLLGYSGHLPAGLTEQNLSLYALYLLMFLVGISIGADKRSFRLIRQQGPRLAVLPLVTIAGTLLGVTIVSLFLQEVNLAESLAVGAGMGYYSLSSVIISEWHSESLGVVALLSNVLREVITLLLAPAMVVWFGRLSPIVSAGATSMDTTLPVITATSGKDFAMVALYHGMVLTILVPILVTLFVSLI
jgi:uncharacterized membrane protein YbjE (DUF340 family)